MIEIDCEPCRILLNAVCIHPSYGKSIPHNVLPYKFNSRSIEAPI